MKDLIAGILIPISESIYTIFYAIPLWAVKAGIFGVLALLAYWVIRMRPQMPEGEGKSAFSDLRYFALFVLALQAVLYVIF